MLRYLEGQNYKQIEQATGIAEVRLKGILHRGITKLRARLSPLYNECQNKGSLHEEV